MIFEEKEWIKIYAAKEYYFVLKAEFFTSEPDAKSIPSRTLEVNSFAQKNNLYYTRSIEVSGPGWRTDIAFDKADMNIYKADIDYCNYLAYYESKIPYVDNEKENRPFVGVVLCVNGKNFFAPLTSPKKKHLEMKDMQDFLKIDDGKLMGITFYKEKNHIRLQPENSTMDPIIVPDCKILGKVGGVFRKM